MELERLCQSLRTEVEDPCERQEVFKDMVVIMKDMQRTASEDCQRKIDEELKELEGQRAKEALVHVRTSQKLIKMEDERERTRTMERLEVTNTTSPWSGGQERQAFGSCSSSFASNADEAMLASSRMALEVEKTISEESRTAFAEEKERDCWSIDTEVNWTSWR